MLTRGQWRAILPESESHTMINTVYIEKIESENTGGGCMVDFVILKDGRVLGINDEYVCLYASMDDFWEARSENVPTIELKGATK